MQLHVQLSHNLSNFFSLGINTLEQHPLVLLGYPSLLHDGQCLGLATQPLYAYFIRVFNWSLRDYTKAWYFLFELI